MEGLKFSDSLSNVWLGYRIRGLFSVASTRAALKKKKKKKKVKSWGEKKIKKEEGGRAVDPPPHPHPHPVHGPIYMGHSSENWTKEGAAFPMK